MKYTWALLIMILLGVGGLVTIFMFEMLTLNNDSEYYVLKEAMEAAMIESVDVACFRATTEAVDDGCDGELKISEQKFVENFTRRFAENIVGSVDDYTIDFYDIMEKPPKASIVISSSDTSFQLVTDSVDIKNSLSGILETGIDSYYALVSGSSEDTITDVEFGVPGGDASSGTVSDVDTDACSDCEDLYDEYDYSCTSYTSSSYALELSEGTIDVELPIDYYASSSYSLDSSTGILSLGDSVNTIEYYSSTGRGNYGYQALNNAYVCSDGSQSCTSGYKLYTSGTFTISNGTLITEAHTFDIVVSDSESYTVCDYD